MAGTTMNPYLRTKVLTASPQELRLLLYEGALKFCRQARPALAEKRFEESYQNLTRARHIVSELSNGLNRQVHPEICDRLAGLYNYLFRRIIEANIKRDPAILDEVIELLEYERETWQMLMERHSPEASSDAGPEANEEVPAQSSVQPAYPTQPAQGAMAHPATAAAPESMPRFSRSA